MLLRVLSFNTWGVPFFSRDRAARIRAIGRAIAAMDVDVIGLQEVFSAGDRKLLVEAAGRGGLVHSHYFQSGLMGSGLLTLSRYPIVDRSFLRFRLNGRPQDLVRVDYYAGKGVGRVRVLTPEGPVDVYNAHLIAPISSSARIASPRIGWRRLWRWAATSTSNRRTRLPCS